MSFRLDDSTVHASKEELYASVHVALEGLVDGESDWISNSANCSALIFQMLPQLNWAGFYFLKGDELVLGPFQGKPACVRIAVGRGVCGTAVLRRETILVPDVHAFPGHIACDSASRSEIVVPLLLNGECVGVLDLDSPVLNRFDDVDADGLAEIVRIFLASSDLNCI
ncbi:GAF domain-containing protein [Planctomicrobium sp. SH668]|uniref:GAF domain-containing protein n=1 Tax=Planctomicrobium sp. SH668 TaxID=3448126 RepID=UPI003F5B24AD